VLDRILTGLVIFCVLLPSDVDISFRNVYILSGTTPQRYTINISLVRATKLHDQGLVEALCFEY